MIQHVVENQLREPRRGVRRFLVPTKVAGPARPRVFLYPPNVREYVSGRGKVAPTCYTGTRNAIVPAPNHTGEGYPA